MRTPGHDGRANQPEQSSPPETPRDTHAPVLGRRGQVISLRPHTSGSSDASPDGTRHQPGPIEDVPENSRVVVTILFTDIVDSTARAVELGDRRWLELRRRHDDFVRDHAVRFGGRVLQNTGDGLLAVFDVPVQAVRAAARIQVGVRDLGLEVRAGVHTGECELHHGELAGIAFHVGARVAAKAAPGEVLVSHTVRDLALGSELSFVDRGAHALKGLPGEWYLYAAQGADHASAGGGPWSAPRGSSA